MIGAQRYHGTDVSDTSKVYGGRGFGYNYDPIGNRTSASETIGGETLVKTYAANELNQYTSIANPVAVGLRGTATNTAVVTVNGDAATRDSVASNVRPWHFALPADNANGGKYTRASIMAVVNPSGTNTQDSVDSATGFVYAPPQNETPTYDDDGNLLSDGHWHYIWNGENRLIKAEEQVCPTNRTLRKVDYAYDHQGRMVWKKISHGGAEAQSWEMEKTLSYLWDNFNIIAETSVADSATNITYNVWGLDLDGTMQGAGGVGGLLAVISPLPSGEGSTVYLPCYDANGNIMEYVSDDRTIAAHCEYDPFGGTVVATGDTDAFTHWFSTKPWCAVTGLSEYQYRMFNPVLGRWLNRDPIGEEGDLNVFGYCANNPIARIDFLGFEWMGSLGENGGALTYNSPPYKTEGPLGFLWGYIEMSIGGTANYKVVDIEKSDCFGPAAEPITRESRLRLGFMSASLTVKTKYGQRQEMSQSVKTTEYLLFTVMDTNMNISDKGYIWSESLCKCFERTVNINGNGTIIMNNAGVLVSVVVLENAIKFFPELGPIIISMPKPAPAPIPVF